MLIWSTYPNMGIDDRNQLEMVESMPGGIEGVRQMVADFHRRGVRVLFPMMMWDEGTHEPRKSWPEAIAALMKAIDADGINGDTQDGVPLGFSLAAEKIGHPLAFEPEGSPSDEALGWDVMTWGQYNFPFIPEVDRYKWLETRHMVNISDRWNRIRPTICNSPSSTAWDGKAGKISGASGTASLPAMRRPRAVWRPLSADRPVPGQPGVGAALSHAQLRRVCQPLAAGSRNRLDHRQPHRLRHRRAADGCALYAGNALLRPLPRRGVEARLQAPMESMRCAQLQHRGATDTAQFWPRPASRAKRSSRLCSAWLR